MSVRRSLFAVAIVLGGLLLGACETPQPRNYNLLPEDFGLQAETFSGLDLALNQAMDERSVPGAVLAVGKDGMLVYERAVGFRDVLTEPLAPMERDTLFDVASLTKPIVTSTAASVMLCRGEVQRQDLIQNYSMDELLRHATDLPSYADWRDLDPILEPDGDPAFALSKLLQTNRSVWKRFEPQGYSNLGYIFAAAHLEEKAGESLESYLNREVWQPLGMTSTTYRPEGSNVVRTSKDVSPGLAFDPLASYLLARTPGHSPGHSGLFSTAADLTAFAQALLHPDEVSVPDWNCVSETMFDTSKVRRAYAMRNEVQFASGEGRTLAFEPDTSLRPGVAFLQSGYTGTLIWLDRESGTSLVLLTNATLTDEEGWKELRDDVLREIKRGLGYL